MLQRGRGGGWLAAVRDPERGRDDLLTCLRQDPRLESQEYRSPYYATLAMRLGVAAEEIAAQGVADEHSLTVSTLAEMAARGVRVPLPDRVLQGYGVPEWTRLAAWPADTPAAVALHVPRGELLASPDLLERLTTTSDPAEIAVLRDVASNGQGMPFYLAWEILGRRGDLSLFDRAEAALGTRSMQGAGSRRYFRSLPAPIALPLARQWIRLSGGHWAAAASMLGEHAEPEDVPYLRELLPMVLDWDMDDIVRALGRVPELGPYPELSTIYQESCHPFLRGRAAEAMARTDLDFGSRYGFECLWDCDSLARLQGVRFAPMGDEVAQRLREIATDGSERDDLQAAALSRLS
ncbi:MAG: hypothetical protein QM582_09050 [Micropruina sp.]|uniref:hypothetical protein n=1 Tax=Micropruina sp. TaxID=2737536 RepID=UPI0039E4AAA9